MASKMASKMAAIGYQIRTFTRFTMLTYNVWWRHFFTTFQIGAINPFIGLFVSFKVNKKVKAMLKCF